MCGMAVPSMVESSVSINKANATASGMYCFICAPNGDFDFNVVIRTLLYNSTKKYLSYSTGSAITLDAEAEKEYEECITKVGNILRILSDI